MKYLGAIFFKEPAQIFVQLIISKALSPIFVSSYLSKKDFIIFIQLTRTLIHVRKILCLSNAVVNAPRSFWELRKQLISSNSENGIFVIIIITVTKSFSSKCYFYRCFWRKQGIPWHLHTIQKSALLKTKESLFLIAQCRWTFNRLQSTLQH